MGEERELSAEKIGAPAPDGEQQYLVTALVYYKTGAIGQPRGYYLRCRIEGRKDWEGATLVSVRLAGPRHVEHLATVRRFNEKALETLTVPADLIATAREKVRTAYETEEYEAARRKVEG
jgi:hypothetical protein